MNLTRVELLRLYMTMSESADHIFEVGRTPSPGFLDLMEKLEDELIGSDNTSGTGGTCTCTCSNTK